ncbi:MAG: hypothetical protein HOO96_39820 [Polyangiaceae bacterium]|nr:hypothetical protein [Polyangiaceae bacterium]
MVTAVFLGILCTLVALSVLAGRLLAHHRLRRALMVKSSERSVGAMAYRGAIPAALLGARRRAVVRPKLPVDLMIGRTFFR